VQRLSGTEVLGVVEGGFDTNERLRSAEETAKRPVAGVLSNLLLLSLCESMCKLVGSECEHFVAEKQILV